MSRINIILAAIAAVQLAVVLFLNLGTTTKDSNWAATPVLTFDVTKVQTIELEADNKEAITLARSNDTWVVSSSEDYAARKDTILTLDEAGALSPTSTALLNKLSRLEVTRPVITKTDNHAQVNVSADSFSRRLTFKDSGNGVLGVLYLGQGSGASNQTYVRRDGEDEVFASKDVNIWSMRADTSSWVNTQYVNLKMEDVTSFSATIGDLEPLKLSLEKRELVTPSEKEGEEPTKTHNWFAKGHEDALDTQKVETILRKLTQVNLKAVIGKVAPSSADSKPLGQFEIKVKDVATTLELAGKVAGSEDFQVKSSGSEYFVTVSNWALKDVLDMTLEGLKPDPPEVPKNEAVPQIPNDGK